jgi:hypothetical protein
MECWSTRRVRSVSRSRQGPGWRFVFKSARKEFTCGGVMTQKNVKDIHLWRLCGIGVEAD